MKIYNLQISPLIRVMPFVVLGIISFGAPALIFTSGGPMFLLVPLLAVAAWNWWIVLTIAYRVVINDDDSLEWVALARRVKVRPEKVREMEIQGTLLIC